VQKAVFIPGEDLFTAASSSDSGIVKTRVLEAQAEVLGLTLQDPLIANDMCAQPVTNDTWNSGGATYPGKWNLTKRPDNRQLLFAPHQRPSGEKGVVTIVLTLPLKQVEDLCSPPYIYQQFFMDGGVVGINIRKMCEDVALQVLQALAEAGGSMILADLRKTVPAVDRAHRRVLTDMRDKKEWVINPSKGVWTITDLGRSQLA
jgi:hypothetical protein